MAWYGMVWYGIVWHEALGPSGPMGPSGRASCHTMPYRAMPYHTSIIIYLYCCIIILFITLRAPPTPLVDWTTYNFVDVLHLENRKCVVCVLLRVWPKWGRKRRVCVVLLCCVVSCRAPRKPPGQGRRVTRAYRSLKHLP